MQHDLNKIAADLKRAHAEGRSFRLPAMTMRDIGVLAGLLNNPVAEAHASALVH